MRALLFYAGVEKNNKNGKRERVKEIEARPPFKLYEVFWRSGLLKALIKTNKKITMMTIVQEFTKLQLRTDLPDIRPGDTVEVHQIIKEKDKQRIQAYEGLVIARKHGKGISATITVRKVISGVGVEKVFPIHSPFIEKIKVIKRSKVRRAKLYYLRHAKGEKAKLKRKDFASYVPVETPTETPIEATENTSAEQKSEDNSEVKTE